MATKVFASSFDVGGVRTIATFPTFAEARADIKNKIDAWEAALTGPYKRTPCACPPRCQCGSVDGEIYGDDEETYESTCNTLQNIDGRVQPVYGFFSVTAVDVPAGESAAAAAAALPRDGVAIPISADFLNQFMGLPKPESGEGAAGGPASS